MRYIHDVSGLGGHLLRQHAGAAAALPSRTSRSTTTGSCAQGRRRCRSGQLGRAARSITTSSAWAVRWRSAFADYQNGNVQYGQRLWRLALFHHNIVLGTGDLCGELFPTVVAGDTHAVKGGHRVADNYFDGVVFRRLHPRK